MKKRASLSISLETIIGLVLAVIAIVAISTLIGGLFDIFIDKEKEKGVEDGFLWLSRVIADQNANFPAKNNIQLDKDVVIVGFNPGDGEIRGHCNKNQIPRDIDLAISRDPIKCPNKYPCLCLCQADFSSWSFGQSKFDYIDCQNAICTVYKDDDTIKTRFKPTFGCTIPLLFNRDIAYVEIKKTGYDFSFKKVQQ